MLAHTRKALSREMLRPSRTEPSPEALEMTRLMKEVAEAEQLFYRTTREVVGDAAPEASPEGVPTRP